MRAVAVESFGVPCKLIDQPRPQPGPSEMLVRNIAASMNPADWKIADGIFGANIPHHFPLLLGVDGAGVVEETGENITEFSDGDTVYGQFLSQPIGSVGTYTEYMLANEKCGLSKVPVGLKPKEAAALPTAGMTALLGLEQLKLRKGQSLLVVGGSGGVGSFATLLAVNIGVHVLCTSRSNASSYLDSLGAWATFDASEEPPIEEIRSKIPQGVDALFDTGSDPIQFRNYAILVKSYGGVAASTIGSANPSWLMGRRIRPVDVSIKALGSIPVSSRYASPLDHRRVLDRLARAMVANNIPVPITEEIDLADVPDRETWLRQDHHQGKTIIVP